MRILREYAAREPEGKPKRIVLRFLTSPVELQGDERVERIVVERNRLEAREDGSLAARPTGERETMDCGLVLRSIGYKGIAIPEVPFDERRGTIPNVAGRVIDGEHHLTGEYVTGWIRRGPSGVIGTNKKDGQEAATCLIQDAEAGLLNAPANDGDIADLFAERGVEPVSWQGWERIDAHEQELGAGLRPRVKLTRYELLHGAARGREVMVACVISGFGAFRGGLNSEWLANRDRGSDDSRCVALFMSGDILRLCHLSRGRPRRKAPHPDTGRHFLACPCFRSERLLRWCGRSARSRRRRRRSGC